jgi:2-iminobutanoate/2-iminopropanoate deaminase
LQTYINEPGQGSEPAPEKSGNRLLPPLAAERGFILNCGMDKIILNTGDAPSPIGPYSQAVMVGNLVFISGQVAINPATGNVEAKDVIEETHQVMHNLKAVLAEAGVDFHRVVKTTIFLTDMSLFSTVNEVYGKYFHGDFPARETVAVKGLPKNVNVEISMIAVK